VDELRVLKAAQTLRVRPGRGPNQGIRDHAAIAVLFGSGWWHAWEPDSAEAAAIYAGNRWGQVSIVDIDPAKINLCTLQSQLLW